MGPPPPAAPPRTPGSLARNWSGMPCDALSSPAAASPINSPVLFLTMSRLLWRLREDIRGSAHASVVERRPAAAGRHAPGHPPAESEQRRCHRLSARRAAEVRGPTAHRSPLHAFAVSVLRSARGGRLNFENDTV